MNFTEKQLKDLETIEYFIPHQLKHVIITDEDREMFLENSERGLHDISLDGKYRGFKEGVGTLYDFTGYQVLRWGKIWRGRMIHEEYKKSFEGGIDWVGFKSLFEDMPASVVEYIKKELHVT